MSRLEGRSDRPQSWYAHRADGRKRAARGTLVVEEGVDYPLGGKCPECPIWASRDRWSGDVLH